ncbi:hypothetical protein NQ176_g5886 [Zarea fungicola]|uniref:Uncharacterized protein n=1 Tax=Zarea fungicola TaxID=93591 RepID=A0ACC1N685_9HYPO|nr:hypothetical protein NQ176_g5886 [Lecanicillium fungicola]
MEHVIGPGSDIDAGHDLGPCLIPPVFRRSAAISTTTSATDDWPGHLARSLLTTPVTPFNSPSAYPAVDGFDPGLLEYYLLRICPLTSSSNNSTTPFFDLMVPLLFSAGYELTSLAIMAFSARHRSLSHSSFSYLALSLKGKALSALRKSLGASTGTTKNALRNPQIPISMMFLCLFEIIDSCDHRWVIHLRACQDFLSLRKQLTQPSHEEASIESIHVPFAERFFAFQDAISRTACGNSSVFSVEYWQNGSNWDDAGCMGCSPQLAYLIFKTTELSRRRGRISFEEFDTHAATLERELLSLARNAANLDHHLLTESAQLYQCCLLRDAAPSTPVAAKLAQKIIQGIYDVRREPCMAGGLAFSLFIAAAELDPLDDEIIFNNNDTTNKISGRRAVLEILEALSGVCLFNVERVRGVINHVWANRDLDLDGEAYIGVSLKGESSMAQNDWSINVSPYCANLSLL